MQELKAWKLNGFLALLIFLALVGFTVFSFINGSYIIGSLCIILSIFILSSLTIIQPNQAKAITFFGKYIGSIRESGLFMVIPFTGHKNISLRVRNFNSKTLKVNDVDGNPIEIAAVIVFRVVHTAKALFEVENYEEFVEIQSETALRHVATKYPYDNYDETALSLRANAEEVADELTKELQARLIVAGLEVMEARLTHLAYATEIASAMLQRQQANAIVSARQKIVEGAVGMAQMAIEQLQRENVVELDEERKVAMINNLMVAIVSDRAAQPVINTGSLYS